MRTSNPTGPAKRLYRFVYGEPWPKGWRVEWRQFLDPDARKHGYVADSACGLTFYDHKLILLSVTQGILDGAGEEFIRGRHWPIFFEKYPEPESFAGVIETMLHEFVHMRGEDRHTRRFQRLLDEAKWTFTHGGHKGRA